MLASLQQEFEDHDGGGSDAETGLLWISTAAERGVSVRSSWLHLLALSFSFNSWPVAPSFFSVLFLLHLLRKHRKRDGSTVSSGSDGG